MLFINTELIKLLKCLSKFRHNDLFEQCRYKKAYLMCLRRGSNFILYWGVLFPKSLKPRFKVASYTLSHYYIRKYTNESCLR